MTDFPYITIYVGGGGGGGGLIVYVTDDLPHRHIFIEIIEEGSEFLCA